MNITLGKITSNQRHQPDPVLSDPELTSKGGNEPGKGNNSGTFLSDKAEPFFDVVTIDEAVKTVRSIAKQTGTETIIIDEADGRVLAESIITQEDIPGFDRSWKDGYAVIAEDTYAATENSPIILSLCGSIAMGKTERGHIQSGECMYIPTGGQMPDGADAVVMIEYAEHIGDKVLIRQPVVVRENVIAKDEDFSAGTIIYPVGSTLRPQDIGVLAAIGKTRISVRKNPRIAIISTGVELVPAEAIPRIGEVREVNSHLISVFLRRQGATPVRYGIIRDNLEELIRTIETASHECDAVIVSGGSSKDRNDITFRAIASLGKVFVHGISIAPGKPTIIGQCEDVPVIGLPGHPVSTFMVMTLVAVHLIQAMKGAPCQHIYKKTIKMATDLKSEGGREQYIRVRIDNDQATPVLGKSGLLNTLLYSDGIIHIPSGKEGLVKGEEVEVRLW
ncbi:molybdopterin molybdotransferase MoeA [Methanospirillum sp. J.3.6.1-F.2.7.3]|jgi:molybdopterin molybdotransferase|uniref:Molybdopterin molybdotransferase MoeA n=1 Tax=Methanospirillum purgamenti TaxID=2834276 RepID=A0A8E7B183_9EURY|nr:MULTISPECIES: gephyrin-like molybdotransferase Glp [Methanospirillum]MDX8548837.1 molybdopterin molybdotransferase MoeA [Methanospirillum hungatei]QVV88532.1 molybdopterin molybdotransferase MoeA [Methanospirillum sp. J.3.6.1-F.2.7.3]